MRHPRDGADLRPLRLQDCRPRCRSRRCALLLCALRRPQERSERSSLIGPLEREMTEAEKLAAFVGRAGYDTISEPARQQLKIRVLDSIGCAIGALDAEPIGLVRAQVEEFGGNPLCTLNVSGERAPDRAAS